MESAPGDGAPALRPLFVLGCVGWTVWGLAVRSSTTLVMGMSKENSAIAAPAIQPTPAMISSETSLAPEDDSALRESVGGCSQGWVNAEGEASRPE